MAPPQTNANGVLPVTLLQKNPQVQTSRGPKAAQPRLNEVIAPLRRDYVVEALDGMLFQGEAAIRFLSRNEDREAEEAMARLFNFARLAAAEMKSLRNGNV